MELRGTLARAAALPVGKAQRWDGIDRFLQQLRIMHVGPGYGHRQRHAQTVDDEVPLGAQLAAIGWVLASRFAPPGAGTLALSSDARSQSMRPRPASAARGGGAAAARPRRAASRAGAASTSSHCHTLALGAASP